MKVSWRSRKQPWNTRIAFEVGRSALYGDWYAYLNIRNRNYWIKRC